MLGLKRIRIRTYQKGLYFRNGEFRALWGTGRRWLFDPLRRARVDVVSVREPWLVHPDLDLIVRSGCLGDQAMVLDLKDQDRALVWVDNRFQRVLTGGLYALWTTHRTVHVEVVDAAGVRFDHPQLAVILKGSGSRDLLEEVVVPENSVGVYFLKGTIVETLSPGRYVFWRHGDRYRVESVDLTERSMDIAGQDIMTADKVTLRLNALIVYRVTDAVRFVRAAEDAAQMLYRQGQLALRELIGTQDLDGLLSSKTDLARQWQSLLTGRAEALGIEIVSLGIRDVILPGDMRDLLNKVMEASKAAEANLIARREETAAMRSQANTAKLLEGNPVLMRLRELEVLEKISAHAKLQVVLGEKGLAERVVNVL